MDEQTGPITLVRRNDGNSFQSSQQGKDSSAFVNAFVVKLAEVVPDVMMDLEKKVAIERSPSLEVALKMESKTETIWATESHPVETLAMDDANVFSKRGTSGRLSGNIAVASRSSRGTSGLSGSITVASRFSQDTSGLSGNTAVATRSSRGTSGLSENITVASRSARGFSVGSSFLQGSDEFGGSRDVSPTSECHKLAPSGSFTFVSSSASNTSNNRVSQDTKLQFIRSTTVPRSSFSLTQGSILENFKDRGSQVTENGFARSYTNGSNSLDSGSTENLACRPMKKQSPLVAGENESCQESYEDIQSHVPVPKPQKHIILVEGDIERTIEMDSNLDVHEAKKLVAQKFGVEARYVKLAQGGKKMRKFHTLEGGNVTAELNEDVSSSDSIHFSYDHSEPKVITVKFQKEDGSWVYKEVAVVNRGGRKQYIGGYRDRRTGIEYYNVCCQTEPKNKHKARKIKMFTREVQTHLPLAEAGTNPNKNQITQTIIPAVTSVWPTFNDKIVSVKTYIPYDQMRQTMTPTDAALILQRSWRKYLCNRMFRQYFHRLYVKAEEEKNYLYHQMLEFRKRQILVVIGESYPSRTQDFAGLYEIVNDWVRFKVEGIKSTKDGFASRAAFMALLEDEYKMLGAIEAQRIRAREANLQRVDERFLKGTSLPRPRVYKEKQKKHVTLVCDLNIQKAKIFKEMMARYRSSLVSSTERLEMLSCMRTCIVENLGERDWEIIELIKLLDREMDLINMGVPDKQLHYLRNRFETLFMAVSRNPEYNPQAKYYVDSAPTGKKYSKYQCRFCGRWFPVHRFAMGTRMKRFSVCLSCAQLEQNSRPRVPDLVPYGRLLEKLRADEIEKNALLKTRLMSNQLQEVIRNSTHENPYTNAFVGGVSEVSPGIFPDTDEKKLKVELDPDPEMLRIWKGTNSKDHVCISDQNERLEPDGDQSIDGKAKRAIVGACEDLESDLSLKSRRVKESKVSVAIPENAKLRLPKYYGQNEGNFLVPSASSSSAQSIHDVQDYQEQQVKILEVAHQNDDSTWRLEEVFISDLPTRKQFLGGYRNKKIGTVFYHTSCQTMPRMTHSTKRVKMFTREAQTYLPKVDCAVDTAVSETTQTPVGPLWPNFTDRVVSAQPYIPYNEQHLTMSPTDAAIVIQRAVKSYLTKMKFYNLFKGVISTIRARKKWKADAKKTMDSRRIKLLTKVCFPTSRNDFSNLVACSSLWSTREEKKIMKNFSKRGFAGKAQKLSLLLKETKMLWAIERQKIKAREENLRRQSILFLEGTANSRARENNEGGITLIDDLNIQRAKGFKEMFASYVRTDATQAERLEMLSCFRSFIHEYIGAKDWELMKLVELLDREVDMIHMGVPGNQLTYLRKRFETAFLAAMRNPAINPQAKYYRKHVETKKKYALYQCKGCFKNFQPCRLMYHIRMKNFGVCVSCSQLNRNVQRFSLNLAPYVRILDALRNEEKENNTRSAIPFLLQPMGTYFIFNIIWGGKCAITESNYLPGLRLTRWLPHEEWTMWNTILLTERMADNHNKIADPLNHYTEQFIANVRMKNILGRMHFAVLSDIDRKFRQKGETGKLPDDHLLYVNKDHAKYIPKGELNFFIPTKKK